MIHPTLTTILLLALLATTNAFPTASTELLASAAQLADTAESKPDPPIWMHAATVWLIFYDVVVVGLFVWIWACGYLVRRREEEWRAAGGRTRHSLIETEMRRVGMW